MVRITRQMWNDIKGNLITNDEGEMFPTGLVNVVFRHGGTSLSFSHYQDAESITMTIDDMRWYFDYLEIYEGFTSHTLRLFRNYYSNGIRHSYCVGTIDFTIDDHDEHSLVYNYDIVSWIEDKGLTYTEARRYIMNERGLSAEKIAEAEGQGVSRGAVALSINSAKDKIFARKQ